MRYAFPIVHACCTFSDLSIPAGKIVHAILDNYASHKYPKVRAWLGRRRLQRGVF